MKIHITKVIEDRSPAVVVQALEKCLKQEAWEIRRFDTRVVALGIGTSRNAVIPPKVGETPHEDSHHQSN